MKPSWKDAHDRLIVVDEYEAQHGNTDALMKACSLMIKHMRAIERPLPDYAVRGLEIAENFNFGLHSANDLLLASRAIEARLSSIVQTPDTSPDECIGIAVRAALLLSKDPTGEDGASEVLSNYLELADVFFECDHSCFIKLLAFEFRDIPEDRTGKKAHGDIR